MQHAAAAAQCTMPPSWAPPYMQLSCWLRWCRCCTCRRGGAKLLLGWQLRRCSPCARGAVQQRLQHGAHCNAPCVAFARACAHAALSQWSPCRPARCNARRGPLLVPFGCLALELHAKAERKATNFNHALVAHAQTYSTTIARHDSLCYGRVCAAVVRRPSALRCAQFTAIGRAALFQHSTRSSSAGSCTLLAGRLSMRRAQG